MSKIKKLSSALVVLLNILLILLPLSIIGFWIFIENALSSEFFSVIIDPSLPIQLEQVTWSFTTKLMGLSGSMIGHLPLFIGMLVLKNLFHSYKEGKIFTVENAKRYKMASVLLLVDGILAQPVSGAILTMSSTWSNPVGKRMLSVSFGNHNISSIIIGLIILAISYVMIEASQLHDDQELTI